MYVRAKAKDADKQKSYLSELFGKLIFIERNARPDDEIAFVTPSMTERDIDEKLEILSKSMSVESKIRLL